MLHDLRYLSRWVLPSVIMVGIFWLSHQPGFDMPPPFPYCDKLVHLGLYALLAVAAVRAVHYQWGVVTRRCLTLVIVAAVLYGMSDEWHQSFIPGRTPEFLDVCADAIGACIGVYGYHRYWCHAHRQVDAVSAAAAPS
jgi:VanZ family protein